MHDPRLPNRVQRQKSKADSGSCPAHRAWVRKHHCCVPDCRRLPIECAHVRGGTDGGMALKPSDRWVISLCSQHHQEQHRIGENRFEKKYDLDLAALAKRFAELSPILKANGAAKALGARPSKLHLLVD